MFVSGITELVSVKMSFNKTNRNSSGRYIKVKCLNVWIQALVLQKLVNHAGDKTKDIFLRFTFSDELILQNFRR